jgi:predicted Zn-dependent peptidase
MIHSFTKTHSRLSTIIVAFDAGSRSEGKKFNPGIAHMLEHCIFKGTEKRDWQSINREIAFLGGNVNAFTSHEMVQYYISVPIENLDSCMEILSDMVFNSTFPEEEFLKEKEVVKEEEVSRNDSPEAYIWKNFSENFFSNYLGTPVIGTQESISRFTRDEVAAFHQKFCKREAAVVSLCSNMSKAEAKLLMTKHFGKASGRIAGRKSYEGTSYKDSKLLEITKAGIEHSYVYMGMPSTSTPGVKDPTTSVMNTILSGGMDARLFTEIREKRGLVYGISAGSISWQGGGSYIVDFSTRDKNVEEALSVTREELVRMANVNVTDEELQRAKNKLRSSFYAANESSSSLANWSVKQALFGELSIGDYINRVEAVSAEQVRELAAETFNLDKMLTVICRKE